MTVNVSEDDNDNVAPQSREWSRSPDHDIFNPSLDELYAVEDTYFADNIRAHLADLQTQAHAWEMPYEAVGDWPTMLKISEMQQKDEEPGWSEGLGWGEGGKQLIEWCNALRAHATAGDRLLMEVSELVGLPMPRDDWMIQDIFRQVINLTRTITKGIKGLRARLDVVHLHYMPPYSLKVHAHNKPGEFCFIRFISHIYCICAQ